MYLHRLKLVDFGRDLKPLNLCGVIGLHLLLDIFSSRSSASIGFLTILYGFLKLRDKLITQWFSKKRESLYPILI